jgi:hypothetical protein
MDPHPGHAVADREPAGPWGLPAQTRQRTADSRDQLLQYQETWIGGVDAWFRARWALSGLAVPFSDPTRIVPPDPPDACVVAAAMFDGAESPAALYATPSWRYVVSAVNPLSARAVTFAPTSPMRLDGAQVVPLHRRILKPPSSEELSIQARSTLRPSPTGMSRRALIGAEAVRDALASLDEDFEGGRYVEAQVPWRAALKRAAALSRRYTASLGCRSLDILHVAAALELGLPTFATFDGRQHQLARETGLKAVVPGGEDLPARPSLPSHRARRRR